jgi:hypothetical protein
MPGTGTGSTTGISRSWWTSEGVRWIIVTLLIPFAGLVWNEVQKQEVDRQKQLERVRADEQTRVANARSELLQKSDCCNWCVCPAPTVPSCRKCCG